MSGDFGITTIDTGFGRPGLAASHLLVEQGRAAFIDVGAEPNLPVLLQALEQQGVAPEQVDWVMVTHVHLDHAGAAGALMQQLPNARLVVHPRGARHMIDPSKLIAGATVVYGEEIMQTNYGNIVPVDSERVIEAADGFMIDLAGRDLIFLDTPGHARHHYCVLDPTSRGMFTGDTFGLSYRDLDSEQGPFILPTTTPVQFDPVALHGSIDRLMSLQPERMYLTHFGCLENPAPLAAQLHADIDAYVAMVDAVRDEELREEQLTIMMSSYYKQRLQAHGFDQPDSQLQLLEMDINLNVQGLLCWLQQQDQQ